MYSILSVIVDSCKILFKITLNMYVFYFKSWFIGRLMVLKATFNNI